MINRLIFLVEGKSEQAMFSTLMPRIIPENSKIYFRCLSYEGKSNLKKRFSYKLRAWNENNLYFIILCDKDLDNCVELKKEFMEAANKTSNKNVLIRIAIREVESWYLGDLDAVKNALKLKGFNKKSYDNPDYLEKKPSLELNSITRGQYQKVRGSREIGKYLSIDENKNTSESYRIFLKAIKKIIRENIRP